MVDGNDVKRDAYSNSVRRGGCTGMWSVENRRREPAQGG